MESWKEAIDLVATWFFAPATLIGGAGGLLSGINRRHSVCRSLFEGLAGAVTANVVFPVIEHYAPEPWHYTLFFLSGIGGLRLWEAVYGWMFDDGLVKDLVKGFLQRLGGKHE